MFLRGHSAKLLPFNLFNGFPTISLKADITNVHNCNYSTPRNFDYPTNSIERFSGMGTEVAYESPHLENVHIGKGE
jgi:hypothetical protein